MSNRKKLYTVASFFGGVGGIDLGFEQTGHFRSIYINEFDKYALSTLSSNFTDARIDSRDIHEVKSPDVPHADVIIGGFPCQAFSIAGYRKGFDDERGNLFFELLRIVKVNHPRVILLENVKNLVTHDDCKTFAIIRETLVTNGYYIKWKVLNAKDYGNLPQNRERIYVVCFNNKIDFDNFTFPDPIELTNNLANYIDFTDKVDDKFYYKPDRQTFYSQLAETVTSQDSIYQWRRHYVRENKSGVIPTLTANMGTGGHNVPIVLTNYGIRKLTPRETFNAMGFPRDFILPDIATSHLYKQAGNSVAVPVIKRIAQKIAESLMQRSSELAVDTNELDKVIYCKSYGATSGESYLVSQEQANQHSLVTRREALRALTKKQVITTYVKIEIDNE